MFSYLEAPIINFGWKCADYREKKGKVSVVAFAVWVACQAQSEIPTSENEMAVWSGWTRSNLKKWLKNNGYRLEQGTGKRLLKSAEQNRDEKRALNRKRNSQTFIHQHVPNENEQGINQKEGATEQAVTAERETNGKRSGQTLVHQRVPVENKRGVKGEVPRVCAYAGGTKKQASKQALLMAKDEKKENACLLACIRGSYAYLHRTRYQDSDYKLGDDTLAFFFDCCGCCAKTLADTWEAIRHIQFDKKIRSRPEVFLETCFTKYAEGKKWPVQVGYPPSKHPYMRWMKRAVPKAPIPRPGEGLTPPLTPFEQAAEVASLSLEAWAEIVQERGFSSEHDRIYETLGTFELWINDQDQSAPDWTALRSIEQKLWEQLAPDEDGNVVRDGYKLPNLYFGPTLERNKTNDQ